MKTRSIIIGIIGVAVIALAIWAINLSNTYDKKFVMGKAFQKNCEVVFDNTWKKIQQQASVTNEYKEGFRQVYTEMMDARYSGDNNSLMKWVQESNPTFDSSLYKTLMNTIEGSRNEFTMEQKKLIDIDRELKTMKVVLQNRLILSNKKDLEIKIITSAKTDEVYKTGQENDIEIF